MTGGPHTGPLHIELGERGLHKVVRPLPVVAQHRGQPPQRRQPGHHVLGVLVVSVTAHRETSFVVACSTLCRGVWGRVRLPRTEDYRSTTSVTRTPAPAASTARYLCPATFGSPKHEQERHRSSEATVSHIKQSRATDVVRAVVRCRAPVDALRIDVR